MATRAASFFGEEVGRSFEDEWPELARRLERFLAAKGVDRWLRADVIQETATRLYPRWETLDHSIPLWNLVATIAIRVVHNHRRKESRIELVSEPVPIHGDDVHVRGLQRAQLDKTRSALKELNVDQRRVLLAEVGEAPLPAGTRNRLNVLRLRARARLKHALGPWAPSAITIRLRQLRARVAQKRSTLEIYVPAMANSLMSVAMTAMLGLVGVAGAAGAAEISLDPARTQLEHPRWPSLAERDVHLEPIASFRGSEPPDPSQPKDGAKKSLSWVPGFVANTQKTAESFGEWGRDLGEDGVDLGKDVVDLGKDVIDLGKDVVDLGKDVVDLGKDVVDDQLPKRSLAP